MRPRRIITWAKWTFAVAAVLAVALAVFSKFWWCTVFAASADRSVAWSAEVGNGLLRAEGIKTSYGSAPTTKVRTAMGRCGCWYWGVRGEFADFHSQWHAGVHYWRDP